MLTFRLLPEVEWPRLIQDGMEPFASQGLPPVEVRANWRIIVAEDDGRIIGLSSLRTEVLNDWTIHPEARRSAHLVTGLWQQTRAVLDQEGVSLVHATVQDDQPEVQSMVERLGYVNAPGKLYVLYVPACLLNER